MSDKNPDAVALGRLGGLKGGPARAEKLTPERRKEIAKYAAAVRWESSVVETMIKERIKQLRRQEKDLAEKTRITHCCIEDLESLLTPTPWETT